jgi:hypothetical protein
VKAKPGTGRRFGTFTWIHASVSQGGQGSFVPDLANSFPAEISSSWLCFNALSDGVACAATLLFRALDLLPGFDVDLLGCVMFSPEVEVENG